MTLILILTVIGLLAILAELVLPGGILGVIGGICLIIAVVLTYSGHGALAGTDALILMILIGFASLHVWMRYFHRLPLTKSMMLNESVPGNANLPLNRSLLHQTGSATTDIHPSGRADIAGQRMDVQTEGPPIPRGARVQVVKVNGLSVFVMETSLSTDDGTGHT